MSIFPRSLVLLLLFAADLVGADHVKLGIDVLLAGDARQLAGKRVGLITNPSGVDGEGIATADRLAADKRFKLTRLFGPEHGIRGDAYAGDDVKSSVDPKTGIPVESLYGPSKRPAKESLAAVDVIVFDIQDVGSRTYTYISTLGEAMKACAEAKKPLVVLDRPNPLGGEHFEGPLVRKEWESFIGWSPIPITHGLTVGEMAQFYNAELKIGCDLSVVRMEGWKRSMTWDDTGLLWVQTSPHIPHASSAYAYVATGMIGGITENVNEGVGYTLPFETLAAEFIDPDRFATAMNAHALPGVRFLPIAYKPFYQRHQGKNLRGVRLVIEDAHAFLPVRTSLALLTTLERLYPKQVKFQSGRPFNIHWGDPAVLEAIQRGDTWQIIEGRYAAELKAFATKRQAALLY